MRRLALDPLVTLADTTAELSASGKWQATEWADPSGMTNGGSSAAHLSCAFQQRVRKRQPLGGLAGLGGSPTSTICERVARAFGSGTGTALSKAWV